MSRRYRRNGTPIGDHRVYAIVLKMGKTSQVFEIMPQGIETYEDLDGLVMMEAMSGKFGFGYDRLVITKPEVYLSGADLTDAYLRGANLTDADLTDADFTGAYYPIGPIPDGWRRDEHGYLRR